MGGAARPGFGGRPGNFGGGAPSFYHHPACDGSIENLVEEQIFSSYFARVKPCMIGIILATGAHMLLNNCVSPAPGTAVHMRAVLIAAILAAVMFGESRCLKSGFPGNADCIIRISWNYGIRGIGQSDARAPAKAALGPIFTSLSTG